jgi:hypothetical protein
MEPYQAETVGTMLYRAIYDDPQIRYVLPDEQERRRILPGLIFNAMWVCEKYGEIYTTESVDGGILWIRPSSSRAVPLPSWIGSNLRRCVRLALHVERIQQQLINEPHWYLMALGTDTEKHRLRGRLIEPILARADSEGMPCYLETFTERTLPLYESYGFRIAAAGRIPRGGPDFWAMVRGRNFQFPAGCHNGHKRVSI